MITIDNERDILAVIDCQPTFMPGGELPVPDGDAVVPVINRLLTKFTHAFASQDWHPPGHSSFASTHAGMAPFETIEMPYGLQVLWPDHAIQSRTSTVLHPELNQAMIQMIIRKGTNPAVDSYSAFRDNDKRTKTGLDGWLHGLQFRRIFFTGLATDFCVGWSAEDAVLAGFEAFMIDDACRGIGMPTIEGRTTIDDIRSRLESLGVHYINSTDLD